MATVQELKARCGLVTVKKGKYYTVFRNTRSGGYEIWQTTRTGHVIDQLDAEMSRAEALECLAWEEAHYEAEFTAWLNE